MKRSRLMWGIGALVPVILAAAPAFADDGPPKLDSGDTAWMLASTALVLMMTIPGLALFYAGMVRQKEHSRDHDAVVHDLLYCHDRLDGGGLQYRVHPWIAVHGRLLPHFAARHRRPYRQG